MSYLLAFSYLVGRHTTRPLHAVHQRVIAPVRAADKASEMPPLNVERYGKGACLHVAPTGVRRVCRTTELPKQPKHSVRLILISDTHSQVQPHARSHF